MIEVSLTFSFSTTNNQAGYEACIAGLQLARDFGATQVELHRNSLLVVSRIKAAFGAYDPMLQRYLTRARMQK